MALKPVDRSLPSAYLKKQHEAIRWLAEQGMQPADIVTARWWRLVDMCNKTIRIPYKETELQYNWDTGLSNRVDRTFYREVSLRDTPAEWYLLKSHFYCVWMFVKERPRNWRPDQSVNSLYSEAEIVEIIGRKQLILEPIRANIRVANKSILKYRLTVEP